MATIYNHDISNLVKRLRRYRKELVSSVSAGLQQVSVSDLTRMNSYLDSAEQFKAWMISAPELDLPVSSPMSIEIEAEELGELENHDLDVIVDLLNIIEKELIGSQSAKRSGGLVSHDALRFDNQMVKVRDFVGNYLAQVNPLDLPETVG